MISTETPGCHIALNFHSAIANKFVQEFSSIFCALGGGVLEYKNLSVFPTLKQRECRNLQHKLSMSLHKGYKQKQNTWQVDE